MKKLNYSCDEVVALLAYYHVRRKAMRVAGIRRRAMHAGRAPYILGSQVVYCRS